MGLNSKTSFKKYFLNKIMAPTRYPLLQIFHQKLNTTAYKPSRPLNNNVIVLKETSIFLNFIDLHYAHNLFVFRKEYEIYFDDVSQGTAGRLMTLLSKQCKM